MLLPERMSEITILALNRDKRAVIKALADAKAVHLINHAPVEIEKITIEIGDSLPGAEELADGLTKARYLLGKVDAETNEEPFPEQITYVLERTEELAETYGEHERKLADLAREQDLITKQRTLLRQLGTFQDPVETLFTVKHVTPVLIQHKQPLQTDAVILSTSEHTTLLASNDKEQFKEHIDLTPLETLRGTIPVALHRLDTRERALQAQEEKEHSFIKSFGQHKGFLVHAEQLLAEELLKAQAPLHFGTTKNVTLIKGFIPTKRVEELKNTLATQNIDTIIETKEPEHAPTSIKHAKGIRNFEALIDLYTLPRSMVPVATLRYFPPGVAFTIFLNVSASSFDHISRPSYFKKVFRPSFAVMGILFPSFSSPRPMAISLTPFSPAFFAASTGKLS